MIQETSGSGPGSRKSASEGHQCERKFDSRKKMKKDEEKKNGHVHRKDKKDAVVRRMIKSIVKVGSCSIPYAPGRR